MKSTEVQTLGTISLKCSNNGTKTELYRTNAKSHCPVPAYFALIIIIVVHVVISINKYIQKAREPEDDAGFLKHIAS